MPPTFRDDIVFIDDSQIFSKMDEFEDWGKAFASAKVSFQYGYNNDKVWWVDFTVYDIWPKNFTPTWVKDEEEIIPNKFLLNQNYPNPFNPTTTIKYTIPDVLGRYKVKFDASELTSGIYFYKITSDNFTAVHKMMLIK